MIKPVGLGGHLLAWCQLDGEDLLHQPVLADHLLVHGGLHLSGLGRGTQTCSES